jgi:hypothetical protein
MIVGPGAGGGNGFETLAVLELSLLPLYTSCNLRQCNHRVSQLSYDCEDVLSCVIVNAMCIDVRDLATDVYMYIIRMYLVP